MFDAEGLAHVGGGRRGVVALADVDPALEIRGIEGDRVGIVSLIGVEEHVGLASLGEDGWLVAEVVQDLIAYGDARLFFDSIRGKHSLLIYL